MNLLLRQLGVRRRYQTVLLSQVICFQNGGQEQLLDCLALSARFITDLHLHFHECIPLVYSLDHLSNWKVFILFITGVHLVKSIARTVE